MSKPVRCENCEKNDTIKWCRACKNFVCDDCESKEPELDNYYDEFVPKKEMELETLCKVCAPKCDVCNKKTGMNFIVCSKCENHVHKKCTTRSYYDGEPVCQDCFISCHCCEITKAPEENLRYCDYCRKYACDDCVAEFNVEPMCMSCLEGYIPNGWILEKNPYPTKFISYM